MKHGTKSERNKNMVCRVLNGETLKAVGDRYNITGPRVREVFYATMYRMFKDNPYAGAVKSVRDVKKVSLENWRISKNYIIARLI